LLSLVVAAAAVVALWGWVQYVDVFTGNATAHCASTYQERLDSGEVISAKRQLIPPALKCTLVGVGTGSAGRTFTEYRPYEPAADFAWFLAAHGVLLAAAARTGRGFRPPPEDA
jgi:hypothetical protein